MKTGEAPALDPVRFQSPSFRGGSTPVSSSWKCPKRSSDVSIPFVSGREHSLAWIPFSCLLDQNDVSIPFVSGREHSHDN